mmetsp:Transcript_12464/g.44074  ORF Transcript_12464/g.44074 Transcript_12464/m.44074 type:complete len:255 (-) Transcript_12464:2-766(-)
MSFQTCRIRWQNSPAVRSGILVEQSGKGQGKSWRLAFLCIFSASTAKCLPRQDSHGKCLQKSGQNVAVGNHRQQITQKVMTCKCNVWFLSNLSASAETKSLFSSKVLREIPHSSSAAFSSATLHSESALRISEPTPPAARHGSPPGAGSGGGSRRRAGRGSGRCGSEAGPASRPGQLCDEVSPSTSKPCNISRRSCATSRRSSPLNAPSAPCSAASASRARSAAGAAAAALAALMALAALVAHARVHARGEPWT